MVSNGLYPDPVNGFRDTESMGEVLSPPTEQVIDDTRLGWAPAIKEATSQRVGVGLLGDDLLDRGLNSG